jgi:S1/P1 nuclease
MRAIGRILVALGLAVLGFAPPAAAWNNKGHMAVAFVAYQQLTPAVRDRVDRLLRMNPYYRRWIAMIPSTVPAGERNLAVFMMAATWPDQIKSDPEYRDDGTQGGNRPSGAQSARNLGYADMFRHKYWHFVDTPFSALAGAHLPSIPAPNAQDRIVVFLSVLASPSAAEVLKSYDLTWLLHLVGDIHQPLHAATRVTSGRLDGDNGGNSVQMCEDTACSVRTNLHGMWDGLLGSQEDVASAVAAGRRLAAAPPERVRVLDPAQWVQESFGLARSDVYQLPVRDGVGPFSLTSAYRGHARQVGEARVALAGARLAAVLNRDLARPGVPGTR